MIHDVVRALDARGLARVRQPAAGALVGTAIAPTLRPVIGGLAVESGMAALGGSKLGGSKLGGLPHVDSAFAWPTERPTPAR
jgi:hypothetical protein